MTTQGGKTVIKVANRRPPRREEIHRDTAWRQRLELASYLESLLPERAGLSTVELHHRLPLALLTPLALPAFGPGATEADVLRAFTKNSQERFETIVGDYLAGRVRYNREAYSETGPAHAGYSHIDHLGWLYAEQIGLVLRLLKEDPSRSLVVVDLGTGGGHLLLTLGRVLEEWEWLGRVRMVGVDRADSRDLPFGEELAKVYGLDIEFVRADLTAPGFADELRKRGPDVVTANHVLEHLPGDVQNGYLHDWLLAARYVLSVSVPLLDNPRSSLSDHSDTYDPLRVEKLAASMTLRSAYAVEAAGIDETKAGGLITWQRRPAVRDRGGLSDQVFIVRPATVVVAPDPLLADFSKPFDPAAFAVPRRARRVAVIEDRARFEARGNEPRQVRQLPIKVPYSSVVVPEDFRQFEEMIALVVGHNQAVNPLYDQSYVYLNVFRGMTEFSSYRGLSLNCHGDQLQTLRTGYAFLPDWSYIASNTLPTTLFEQGFDISEAVARARDGERVNVYDYLNAQAKKESSYLTDNFGVYLLSPYVIHSASEAAADLFRVFCKIAISSKRFFDNRELRRNPAFAIDSWYQESTVGYGDGFFSHAHWNERFIARDIPRA